MAKLKLMIRVFESIQERKEAVFIMKFLATLLCVGFLLIQTGKKLNYVYHSFSPGVCFRPYHYRSIDGKQHY